MRVAPAPTEPPLLQSDRSIHHSSAPAVQPARVALHSPLYWPAAMPSGRTVPHRKGLSQVPDVTADEDATLARPHCLCLRPWQAPDTPQWPSAPSLAREQARSPWPGWRCYPVCRSSPRGVSSLIGDRANGHNRDRHRGCLSHAPGCDEAPALLAASRRRRLET